LYYLTLAAYRKEHLFGVVHAGGMMLNACGEIVREEWLRSARLRSEIALDEFVIMPNHLHGIVVIRKSFDASAFSSSIDECEAALPSHPELEWTGRPPRSLGSLVAGFKSAVTVRINALRSAPRSPVWQRNYHDHIIRNEPDLHRIRRYIRENPLKWDADPDNAPLARRPV
jgi:REP element-mobilizing transposase RayT